jgi:hypothetical protein
MREVVLPMTLAPNTLIDRDGKPMFVCPDCLAPLSSDDVVAHNLRVPDVGETRDEYAEAELLDSLSHIDCLRARRAGVALRN